MHDPQSVAFEIYLGRKKKKNGDYRNPLLTIWHCDPETDGTDDSCGRFIRSRHIDKTILEKVQKEFEFNFKHNYWFNDGGYPKFSTTGVVIEMYTKASWIIFMHQNGGEPNRKRHTKFMKEHLYEIMRFAENPTDCIGDSVTMKFGVEDKEYRIKNFVSIIVADIFRKERKWYQNPKWHIHHWKLQFHPIQNIKRRYWDKCCVCKKRGFKSPGMSDWDGTKRWHMECDTTNKIQPVEVNQ